MTSEEIDENKEELNNEAKDTSSNEDDKSDQEDKKDLALKMKQNQLWTLTIIKMNTI